MSDYGDLAQFADPSIIPTLTPDMVGMSAGSNACLDQCWQDFQNCLQSATDGGLACLAQLNYCKMNCGS